METDERNSEERVARLMRLLHEASAGNLDRLECPACHSRTVSVWFTNSAEGLYRSWFLCGACEFRERVQNSRKPDFFSENRRRADLDEEDAAIRDTAVFEKPTK